VGKNLQNRIGDRWSEHKYGKHNQQGQQEAFGQTLPELL
jgi:hypothetical protein